MKTIEDCLKDIEKKLTKSKLFYGHGTDNPWDEAVQLVLHVMQLPAHSGKEVLRHPVSEQQLSKMLELLKKRTESRMPLPYLTHEAWFAGLPFYVDERVLIPRSPFAEWIERQFTPWIKPDNVTRILDIGTGSACMAIAAALAFPSAKVDAVDISPDALEVGSINVKKYELADRLRLIEGDGFSHWQLFTAKQDAEIAPPLYDIIMSNPPYVGAEEMATLPPEYVHEPRLALEAQDQGFAIVERIIREAPRFLKPDGILVVEVGNNAAFFIDRFADIPFVELELERGGEGLFLWQKSP